MHLHKAYQWCSMSHWDNSCFDARYSVTLKRQEIFDWKNPNGNITEDWNNLVRYSEYFDEENYLNMLNRYPTSKEYHIRECPTFTNEVMSWLNSLDDKSWCIGNEKYRALVSNEIVVFFTKNKDALGFIKKFSTYGKPLSTYDSDTYIEKKLNIKTNKLEIVRS